MQPNNHSLQALLAEVKQRSGLKQKTEIQAVSYWLETACCSPDYPNGDDTAAIANGAGYDLLATEGFLTEFVERDPWFAGWCGVMVNVSDIAAMGGRPSAIVNTIWGGNNPQTEAIFEGMAAASKVFNVPIVGGHTNLRSSQAQLAVSILGKANTLLSSFTAQPGHVLVTAIDLRGEFRQPFLNWNAATSAPTEQLRGDIELLPMIAEQALAVSAKDISQAGLLGTCLMLLESAQVGAHIQLDHIPKPEHVSWSDWLCCFPSFGYLMTTPKEQVSELLGAFKKRGISAAEIGVITEQTKLVVEWQDQHELFWDIAANPLTGMTNKKEQPDQQPIHPIFNEVSHA